MFSKVIRQVAMLTGSAMVMAAALAGCSSEPRNSPNGSEEPSSPVSDTLLPPAEGATKYPLTLSSPWGETVLKKRPERIATVAANGSDAELLVALGVTPVLAPDTIERSVYTMEALPRPIEEIYEVLEDSVPLETVAATNPDLIIVMGETEGLGDRYGNLSKIAPVLAGETLSQQEHGTWQERLEAIGQALDLSGTASSFIDGFNEKFAMYRDKHTEFAAKTATVAIRYNTKFGTNYASKKGSDTEALFLALGFVANPLAEQFAGEDIVSDELLSRLDGDVLVVIDNLFDTPGESISDLLDNPLFRELSAVRNGRFALITNTLENAYFYDGEKHEGNLPWALAIAGPLGQLWAAEQLVPILSDLFAPAERKP